MMKNVKLKKILKGTVFKVFSTVNKVIPKKDNLIILYSANKGLMFNLPYMKDYLLENNFHENYEIICGVENLEYVDVNEENVKYVTQIKAFLLFLRASYVFYTAGQIPIKPSRKQKVVLLTHGASSLKAPAGLSKINNGDEKFFNKIVFPSSYYDEIVERAFKCNRNEIIHACEPMTDVFFASLKEYELGNFDKILLWAPTFRQSDYLGYDDSTEDNPLLVFNENDYDNLNKTLKGLNYKLIVKLHPMQNKHYIKDDYENLVIYNHDRFVAEGFNLYELMKHVDLLIGDYSSTSMQFLLLNKPIAFVIPDFEEYKNTRGFIFEDIENFMPGKIIKDKKAFYEFLDYLSIGKDDYLNEREKIKNLLFEKQNGNSCSIVLENIGLKNK